MVFMCKEKCTVFLLKNKVTPYVSNYFTEVKKFYAGNCYMRICCIMLMAVLRPVFMENY